MEIKWIFGFQEFDKNRKLILVLYIVVFALFVNLCTIVC